MAEQKKKKKSAQDFVNSVVKDLTKKSDGHLFDSFNEPTRVAEQVAEALLGAQDFSVQATSTNMQNLEKTSGLPVGIDSKTAVFGKAKDATAVSKDATATTILPEEQENKFEPMSLGSEVNVSSAESQDISEKTMVVGLNRVHGAEEPAVEKISFGVAKPSTRSMSSQNAVLTDGQLLQAENLRIAQQRFNELEKELEKLRAENEQMFSTSEIAREKASELAQQVEKLEREKAKQAAQFNSELDILRDNYALKDSEISKLSKKVEELEGRLRQDLRKVRVRERELENRLELVKMEKDALLRAKDESILELRRNADQLNHELDNYRHRVTELNSKIENNHEQLSRTVRALRLALANLEVSEDGVSMTIAPYKKAE